MPKHLTPRAIPAALLLPLLALAACGPSEPPPPPDVYQTRGLVRQLPDAGKPGSALLIHHEAIAEFKDADGEVVGMESMAMPFPVADATQLDGLVAGDRIGFTFEVHWQGGNPLLVTALEKLPPETRLAFEKEPLEEADAAETDDAETDPAEADPAEPEASENPGE